MELVVKTRDGTPVTHDVTGNVVGIKNPDGEIVDFVPAADVPVAVEQTIEVDWSDGDMVVTPEDGKVFSGVNIPVPTNLIAANIAEGVDVAGIIGTLQAGGSSGGNEFSNIIVKAVSTGGMFNFIEDTTTLIPIEELDAIGFGSASNKIAMIVNNFSKGGPPSDKTQKAVKFCIATSPWTLKYNMNYSMCGFRVLFNSQVTTWVTYEHLTADFATTSVDGNFYYDPEKGLVFNATSAYKLGSDFFVIAMCS